MSAFIQSTAHLDALVTLAIEGPEGNRWPGYASEYFYHDGRSQYVTLDTASKVGQMLADENTASVNYRYSEGDKAKRYTYKRGRRLTIPEGFMAIAGYEYQACEHPGWKDSAAKAFCEWLRGKLISALPGYEAAGTWAI